MSSSHFGNTLFMGIPISTYRRCNRQKFQPKTLVRAIESQLRVATQKNEIARVQLRVSRGKNCLRTKERTQTQTITLFSLSSSAAINFIYGVRWLGFWHCKPMIN